MATRATPAIRPHQRLLPQLKPRSEPIPRYLWPAIIVAYACLLPRELGVTLGTFALPPYRLALLLMAPLLLANFGNIAVRWRWVDYFALLTGAWFSVALAVTEGISVALETGASQTLDFILSYFVGRSAIRSYGDVRILLRALLPGVVLLAGVLVVESVTHRMLVRPLAARITGSPTPFLYTQYRLGLLRAMGPFPHPILAGVYLATILPLAWYAIQNRRTRWILVAASLSLFFTLSSTAFLALAACLALMLFAYVQYASRLRLWPTALALTVLAALFIELYSDGGLISFMIRYGTFDAASGYYRRLIWTYAGAEVTNHPIFGIGLRDWERPQWMVSPSVDSFWLLPAMRYGLPLTVGTFLVMIGGAALAIRQAAGRSLADRRLTAGIAIVLISTIFAGFSVFYWEGIFCWLLLLAGIAVSVGQGTRRPTAPRRPLGLRYRRGAMPSARIGSSGVQQNPRR